MGLCKPAADVQQEVIAFATTALGISGGLEPATTESRPFRICILPMNRLTTRVRIPSPQGECVSCPLGGNCSFGEAISERILLLHKREVKKKLTSIPEWTKK
jgi:hypothetical protein